MLSSAWQKTAVLPACPPLAHDAHVDVVVVGGGITGVTAAYLMKKAGKTVALLEKEVCGGGDTGHTTAHLTAVTDKRLAKLGRTFGKSHAQAVWDAGRAAIHQIDEIIRNEQVDCDFAWMPGFLHAPWHSNVDETGDLKKDARIANDAGFAATFLQQVPLVGKPGVRFSHQAIFHPLKFLAGLLPHIAGEGSFVCEGSEVEEIVAEPFAVKARGHQLTCDYLVIATHVPLAGTTNLLSATILQSKLAPYTSYAVGARLPSGPAPQALFWDTSDPYYYLRVERRDGHNYAILGGEDHKTGQVDDADARFARLESLLRTALPQSDVVDRWSGQVIETNDGLPYIGETAERQFVATGFSGNGMTFGVLSAMMARDAALGRKNPWSELFSVHRKKVRGGTWDYLKENLDYPYYMLKDRLAKAEGESLDSVGFDEGKVIKLNGRRVAAYRHPDGKFGAVSANCTHMGCLVHWNGAERSWDCPCHGSRFKPDGEVLAGPAESPLEPVMTKPKSTRKPGAVNPAATAS